MSPKQQRARSSAEDTAKRNALASPGKEDVHEQREHGQEVQGIVEKPEGPVPEASTVRRGRRRGGRRR